MAKQYRQTRRMAAKDYKQTDKGREANLFYSSRRWKRLRKMKLARNPICERCGEWAATEVHHIRPRLAHPELAYDLDNLMSLDGECHGEVRGRNDD